MMTMRTSRPRAWRASWTAVIVPEKPAPTIAMVGTIGSLGAIRSTLLLLAPRTVNGFSRKRAGHPTVAQDGLAVDDHVHEPDRIRVRLLKRRLVDDGLGIEDDQVRDVSLAHEPAVREAERRRGQGGHLPNGVFEGDHAELSRVVSQHAGVGAVAARVGLRDAEL